MSDAKKQLPDPLVRLRTFPEPDKVFEFSPVPLEEALRTGLVVIDTNVLLLPYTVGQATLTQIRSIFEQLTHENRLAGGPDLSDIGSTTIWGAPCSLLFGDVGNLQARSRT